MDLYREQLLEHYHHPHGWGLIDTPHFQGQGFNPVCGDRITVQLITAGDSVTSMHFEATGCVISKAAASLLSDELMGKKISDVTKLGLADIEPLIGSTVPAGRVQCALLALTTIQKAIRAQG